MADLQRVIEVLFQGDDRLSHDIDNINKKLKGLGSTGASGGFKAMELAAVGAAGAIELLAMAVTGLVGAGLVQAYQDSVNFESAMVSLKKVLGDHPDLLDAAKKSAMDLSAKYGVASDEILGLIANWVQAGYNLADATALAEKSIALMIASESSAEDATIGLTKIVKGFGLEVDEVDAKLDAMNETSNKFAADNQKLTEALSRVAPVAQAMGFTFEDMVSLMTPAIEKFQDGEVVGTAFGTMLLRLSDDTAPVQEALSALGVSQTTSNGEFKTGKEILYEVGAAFQNLDENQKAFTAGQLAGKEHAAKFLAVMNDWEKVGAVYETTLKSAGSIAGEVNSQLASSQKQIERHQVAWKNFAIVVGDQFRIATTEAVKGSTGIVNALQKTVESGSMDGLFEVLRNWAGELEEVLTQIAENLPEAMEGIDWAGLAESMRNVGSALTGIFDGLDLTTVDGLALAIQRTVDSGTNLMNFFANSIEIATPFMKFILDLTAGFNDFYNASVVIWNDIQMVFGLAIAAILGSLQNLYYWLDKVPGINLQPSIDALEEMKNSVFENVQKSFEDSTAASKELDESLGRIANREIKVKADPKPVEVIKTKVEELPEEKKVTVKVDGKEDLEAAIGEMEGAEALVGVKPDKDSMKETTETITYWVEGEQHEITVPVSTEGIEKAKKELEELPTDKQVEIQIQGDIDTRIAEIKDRGETMRTVFEWEAKLDISQVEAQAKVIESAYGSINTSLETSANLIGEALGVFNDENSTMQGKWKAQDILEQEMDLREKAFELQEKLTDSQIALMDAKTKALEDGESLIQIDSNGLEPALEMIMFEILEKIQIKASEEASEFLLGLG